MAAADAETSEPEYFDVKRVSISPNMCPISSPVRFSAVLTSTQNISSAHWEFSWLLDSTRRRYIIVLGKTDTKDYPAGTLDFDFQSGPIDVTGMKASHLCNVGLLKATLFGALPPESSAAASGAVPEVRELGSVQLVVQAVKKEGDEWTRCVLNPWDEV